MRRAPRRVRRRAGQRGQHGQHGQHGQVTVLIIGFAVVLAMMVGLVTDATAAYLRRQSLDTLADGAALRGADLGATGSDVYQGGVPAGDLRLTAQRASRAVRDYLVSTGAYAAYPGLSYAVDLDPTGQRIRVRITAPLDLPLTIPGSPEHASVSASGAALVDVDG